MRIGIFTDTYTPQVNGVVSSVITLEKELEKKGHEVIIVTTTDRTKPETKKNVIRIKSLEFKPLPQYRIGVGYSPRLMKLIKNLNLDIIHAQGEFGVGTFARFVAHRYKIPLVYTYHTLYENYVHYIVKKDFLSVASNISKKISEFYCEKCDVLIAPTSKVEHILKNYGVKKDMYIVPTGIEVEDFFETENTKDDKKNIRQKYNVSDDDFLCLYLGRIGEEKRIDFLIESFSEVLKQNKIEKNKTKFMIVGTGNIVDELKEMVRSLGIEENVIFTGEVPHTEVAKFYHASDLFLNSSISETQGLTFIEAAAAKLPVLARHDENLDDMFVKNEAGLLYKEKEEFIEKFIILYENKELREKYKENAFLMAQNYSAPKFGERVEKIYEETIKNYDSKKRFTIFPGEKFIKTIKIFLKNKI